MKARMMNMAKEALDEMTAQGEIDYIRSNMGGDEYEKMRACFSRMFHHINNRLMQEFRHGSNGSRPFDFPKGGHNNG